MNADVIETWQPKEGDYVRVQRNPECRGWHSQRQDEPEVAYGRVEIVDRSYSDPDVWVAELAGQTCGDSVITADEARSDARQNSGHYYLVQDALGSGRIAMLDGWYCALELTPVSMSEAIVGIVKARQKRDSMTPDQRLWRVLFGGAS